jgi:phage regulator Rha-like protein
MTLFALKLYSKITKKSIHFISKGKTYYIQPNGSVIIGLKSSGGTVRGNRAKYVERFEEIVSIPKSEYDELLKYKTMYTEISDTVESYCIKVLKHIV